MSLTHDVPIEDSRENLVRSIVPRSQWGLEIYSQQDLERKETDYRFPIPNIKGDHWKNCFDVLLKEDEDRYEVWKDEIQNLLIFAGLFSAVVTGFSIDSYKSLQPDSSQTMILLLAQIASRLDNSTSSVTSTAIPPFVPSSASVRINIYWFLSLLLSLTTVLVGIVTLQWLREYQRYKNNVTSKQAFAQRNMRFESLKTWHVNHILTGLPLLLQAALLLFTIGIIEFLIDLSYVVTIPCVVVVSFTLLFYGYTTISPAFQYYWYQLENNSRDFVRVPPPCPYKSPQAWAFISCTRVPVLSHIWRALLNAFHLVYRLARTAYSMFPGKQKASKYKGSLNFSLLSQETDSGINSKKLPLSNWNNIDLIWLRRRHPHDHSNNYDAARGLARIIQLHSHLETIAFSSYHCFSEIASKDPVRQEVVRHMSMVLLDGDAKPMSWTEPDRAGPLSMEEALIGFLNFLPQSSPKNPKHSLLWKHQTELLIRAYTRSTHSHLPSQVTQSHMDDARESCPFLRGVFLLPHFVEGVQYRHENLSLWEDALKTPLKELHQRLGRAEISDFGSNNNERRFLAFLDQFAPRRKSSGPLPGVSQGILEIDRTRTRSSQDLHTAHAHFEMSREHIEISIPPAFSEGIAEVEEGELEAGAIYPQSTNSEPHRPIDSERFLSPYSQSQPDHSHSRSLSTSTLSDNHGTTDIA